MKNNSDMIDVIKTTISYSESDLLKYFQENNYSDEDISKYCDAVEDMIDSNEKELEELQSNGEFDYECGGYWYSDEDRIKIDEVSDFLSNLKYMLRIAESYEV